MTHTSLVVKMELWFRDYGNKKHNERILWKHPNWGVGLYPTGTLVWHWIGFSYKVVFFKKGRKQWFLFLSETMWDIGRLVTVTQAEEGIRNWERIRMTEFKTSVWFYLVFQSKIFKDSRFLHLVSFLIPESRCSTLIVMFSFIHDKKWAQVKRREWKMWHIVNQMLFIYWVLQSSRRFLF